MPIAMYLRNVAEAHAGVAAIRVFLSSVCNPATVALATIVYATIAVPPRHAKAMHNALHKI
jgi:hypothetical protein